MIPALRTGLGVAAMAVAFGLAASPGGALAQKSHGPGVTDREIKLGQTAPYSGPLSSFGTQGKAQAAYFKMINERGGVNGRRINLVSVDDGFSPPKAIEQARRLVEQDEVLLMFAPFGTPTNAAMQKYLNQKGVPAIFLASGATRWNDPKAAPWSMGFSPNVKSEGAIYARYILKNVPEPRIGILFQNDDFGKDFVAGIKQVLGDRAGKLIIKEVSYEPTDPTIDSQIVTLQGAGANVFMNVTGPKFAALAIRKAAEIGWKPLQFLSSSASSVAAVLVPAGVDNAVGALTSVYLKDANDPQWANDAGVKDYLEFMKRYYPEGDPKDCSNVYAVTVAAAFVEVLKSAGDNLTRENVMKQAASLKDVELPLLLPGIRLNTTATDFAPISQQQMVRFDGKSWVRFGEIISE
ncbi:ABC transporter substrate-binding protein [Quisquiliibacterium transsilvanicum]|uniref:Branched-chain amino acid transport system substrate-binding protein n=1 Tax=Quisquiliibacterium transsilvanicum TaxID=1549638 RepID=A0A7W8HFV0_9BURK|nr:ABC transporter substrate-binding protein [Quisquiliibacterium transsilvanicum]MBB5271246.1 branched-chain amino acid transport system substrate-binding protein [Quisquiliibacterium transsilvanicum]